jgi:hypothetical protein
MQGWNNEQSKSRKSDSLTHFSFIGSKKGEEFKVKPKPINTDKGMQNMLKSGINPLLEQEEEKNEL